MPRGGWGRNFEYDAKPRKACTAYNFYVQENYRFLRRYLRDRDPHRILMEASSRWKNLAPDRRKSYAELAERDKIRAAHELRAYQQMVANGLILVAPPRPRVTTAPGWPKPTVNSFLHYANANRKEVEEERPNLDSREVMQESGRRWKGMSFMDKRPYMRQKATDRSRYLAQRRRFREAEREKKRR